MITVQRLRCGGALMPDYASKNKREMQRFQLALLFAETFGQNNRYICGMDSKDVENRQSYLCEYKLSCNTDLHF